MASRAPGGTCSRMGCAMTVRTTWIMLGPCRSQRSRLADPGWLRPSQGCAVEYRSRCVLLPTGRTCHGWFPTSWSLPLPYGHLVRTSNPGQEGRRRVGASGSFLASELLSGKRAGQPLFSGWLGVLPKSAPGGVFVEVEEVEQSRLGGVGVGEDALGSRPAFVACGVEKDGFLDAGEVGQELADAEVQPGLVGLSAHEVGDGQGQDAVEDVDSDLGLGPVEHRGEPDDVGVFELAEP